MSRKETAAEGMEKIEILMHLNQHSVETLRKVEKLIQENFIKSVKKEKHE